MSNDNIKFTSDLECFDKDELYDLCDMYDCRPSELEEEMYNQKLRWEGVEGIIDVSLYPESFSIKVTSKWLDNSIAVVHPNNPPPIISTFFIRWFIL